MKPIDPNPLMHVFYRVKSCTLGLPGVGQCRAHAVCQVNGVADEPAVAVFLSQEHAAQYADYLMLNKISLLKG